MTPDGYPEEGDIVSTISCMLHTKIYVTLLVARREIRLAGYNQGTLLRWCYLRQVESFPSLDLARLACRQLPYPFIEDLTQGTPVATKEYLVLQALNGNNDASYDFMSPKL